VHGACAMALWCAQLQRHTASVHANCSMTHTRVLLIAATAVCLQANCCEYINGSENVWKGCDVSSYLYTCVSQFDDKPPAVCCFQAETPLVAVGSWPVTRRPNKS
jgi:hypothetical protein